MNKQDYMKSQSVSYFIEWISRILDAPNSFHHDYFLKRQKIDWNCDSIFSAYENYTWKFNYTDEYNTIILFGHNPTFTNIANYFLDEKIDNLPTSGLVCIEFETDKWNTIASSPKLKNYVIRPKEL